MLIVSASNASWFSSLEYGTTLTRFPDFASLYPIPSSVGFDVQDVIQQNGYYSLVVRSAPRIGGNPTTKICRITEGEVAGHIDTVATQEIAPSLTTEIEIADSTMMVGGLGGYLKAISDSVLWEKHRPSRERTVWENVDLVDNSVIACRRADSSYVEVAEFDIPMLKQHVTWLVPYWSKYSLNHAQVNGDQVFVATERDWVIHNAADGSVVKPDSVPFHVFNYLVDFANGIVWGGSARHIVAWTLSGSFIGDLQYTSIGLLGSMKLGPSGSLIVEDGTAGTINEIVVGDSLVVHSYQLANPGENVAFVTSADSWHRAAIYDDAFNCTALVKVAHNNLSDQRRTQIVPFVFPKGTGSLGTETAILTVQENSLVKTVPATGTQTTSRLDLPGTYINDLLIVLGAVGNTVVCYNGNDRIGIFTTDTTTTVEEAALPYVFFQQVFPNPTTLTLHAKIGLMPTADINSLSLKVSDVLGNEVLNTGNVESSLVDKLTVQATIDVSDLVPGMYYLTVSNKGYTESRSILVLR